MNVVVDQCSNDGVRIHGAHTHHTVEHKNDSSVQRHVMQRKLCSERLRTFSSCPVLNQQTRFVRNHAPLLFVEYVIDDVVVAAHY